MNGQIEQVAQSLMDNLDAKTSELSQMLAEISSVISAPRKLLRGPDGRATGVDVGGVVRPIQRGPDGRAIGI